MLAIGDECVVSVYRLVYIGVCCRCYFFFQAEDGIRDLVRSRGLGDVYKRQEHIRRLEKIANLTAEEAKSQLIESLKNEAHTQAAVSYTHLTLPTSDLV